MQVLVDTVCESCELRVRDVFIERGGATPNCHVCGASTRRDWRGAPSVTPQGTRPERERHTPAPLNRVDTKAIALEATQEVEAKMLRYSDPVVAEEHISREFNQHIHDAPPDVAPISFPNPAASAAA